jgi:histidinol-phosphate aminotransferase
MRRRSFLRAGAAAALAAPSLLTLPLAAGAHTRSRGLAGPVRLASNENPLGIPESARRAIIDALVDGNRYPRFGPRLAEAVAARLGVQPASVVLGNGSTEVLQMLAQSVAARGGRVILPDPTFEHLEQYARPFDGQLVKVPLTAGHAHDLERMRAAAGGDRPALLFICNPNNPTGTLTSCADVDALIRSLPEHVLVAVDEAYVEFVREPGYRSMLPHIAERKNVMVVRTFSKVYGLAGLRIGYGLAHPELAARVRRFTQYSNLNHFALVAALAALEDRAFVEESLRTNAESQRLAETTLDELGLERLPSHANFVMHRIEGELPAYIERMRARDIMVGRPFPPLTSYNRVSLGTPEEMARWAEALRDFRRRSWI